MVAWVGEEIFGDELRRFRCAGCGYGVSRESPPERCPMCSSTVWHDADTRLAPAAGVTQFVRRRRP